MLEPRTVHHHQTIALRLNAPVRAAEKFLKISSLVAGKGRENLRNWRLKVGDVRESSHRGRRRLILTGIEQQESLRDLLARDTLLLPQTCILENLNHIDWFFLTQLQRQRQNHLCVLGIRFPEDDWLEVPVRVTRNSGNIAVPQIAGRGACRREPKYPMGDGKANELVNVIGVSQREEVVKAV